MKIFLLLSIIFFSFSANAGAPGEKLPTDLVQQEPVVVIGLVPDVPEPECSVVENISYHTRSDGGNFLPTMVGSCNCGVVGGLGGGGYIAPTTTHLRMDMEIICPPTDM